MIIVDFGFLVINISANVEIILLLCLSSPQKDCYEVTLESSNEQKG